MTQQRTALKELQKLDTQIQDARERIMGFDPLFEEVEEPALVLESELSTTRNRLKEMKLEERRVHLSAEERQDRLRRLEERLSGVRNLREEAAVSAELDMVRRALQGDEQETMTLLDQIRKGEERQAELETAYAEAAAEVEPKRDALIADREAARAELARLESERAGFAEGMEANELRIYNAIRAGGRRAAVAELTHDGACANCFGIVPLQSQNEIRHGSALIRCEACGVILAAPEPESEDAEAVDAPEADAEAGATAEADDGAADDDTADGADGGDEKE